MFVLLLSYIEPIEQVDALMREHVATGGVATVELIHFRASQTADGFDGLP